VILCLAARPTIIGAALGQDWLVSLLRSTWVSINGFYIKWLGLNVRYAGRHLRKTRSPNRSGQCRSINHRPPGPNKTKHQPSGATLRDAQKTIIISINEVSKIVALCPHGFYLRLAMKRFSAHLGDLYIECDLPFLDADHSPHWLTVGADWGPVDASPCDRDAFCQPPDC